MDGRQGTYINVTGYWVRGGVGGWGVGATNGSWTLNGAPLLLHQQATTALHYARYRPNQIKVMYGNNTMDFPSTYGLSLSPMTQERGPTAAQTWKD